VANDTGFRLADVPVVAIVLRLECDEPRVVFVTQNDAEERRTRDWIESRPHLAELLALALEYGRDVTPRGAA